MTINVLHVISGLGTGGAEMMLFKLLSRARPDVVRPQVLSLTSIGPVGRKIRELGIPVIASEFKPGIPNPFLLSKVAQAVRVLKPAVIQSWMYHADLIAGLAARIAGRVPVAWGVRHGRPDPETDKAGTLATVKACSLLSGLLPKRIVFCSQEARSLHTRLGYAAERSIVIPNGFDVNLYRPDEEARISVRRQLGIPLDTELVGCIARFDPTKDHLTLVRAAALLLARRPGVRFVFCGTDVTWENGRLAGWIREAGLESRFSLLGPRDDVPRLAAAMDIVALTSITEGFPNVIGEAMATGVPCVVTETGDAPLLVGETGKIVPPRQPEALARALSELLDSGREGRGRLGASARERIRREFSIESVSAQYEQL
ncbi:MAG: glycosyltransferase, partial [Planctomycetes bacterium]|nr:glycosyltransferase [Planctomycetota bacterium]